MTPKTMIWLSVTLSAVAQIFLKQGLSRVQQSRAKLANATPLFCDVMRQPYVWLWALCFALATALWLLGLQKLELSYAYPLVAFGYVLVNVLSAIFFAERVTLNRWIAVAVIGVGVMLIASS
jgi:multidrug transporter EmrE-like cation transporter